MEFAFGPSRRYSYLGALICADWPGLGKISRDNYSSASDLADRLDLGGMVVLFFTAFSAGTPVSN